MESQDLKIKPVGLEKESTDSKNKPKHRGRCIFCRVMLAVGIVAVVVGIALGVHALLLLRPYQNLPHVTAEDLDALDLEGYDKVMIVAHPDDELLWGGQHLIEDDYLVVCITRGNDDVRRAEFEAVLAATGDKGLILSYPDKIGRRRSDWELWREDIEADIATILQYKEWELVASHNEKGEYGHQHHVMTHESVAKEYQETGGSARLCWFGTYYVFDKVPYDLEEMEKSVYNEKREIAKLYKSQRATFRKLYHMMPYEHWTEDVRKSG